MRLSSEENEEMIERQIKLNETEDVQEFVKEAAKCSFDIDISYNRIILEFIISDNCSFNLFA